MTITTSSWRPAWTALLLAAFLLPWLLLAAPVRACSCAGGLSLADYASDANTAVFTGTVGPREARGVPIAVDRWYTGPGAGLVVWVADGSFGDGASCGIAPESVPFGARMIFVGWVPEPGADIGLSICSPYLSLDTADGRALQQEAELTFGLAPPPSSPAPTAAPPTTPGTAAPTPVPSTPPDPEAAGVDPAIVALAFTGSAAAVVLLGTVALARRRR